MHLPSLLVLAASLVFPLATGQSTNTNAQIKAAVNTVDETMHHVGPTVLTIMANQTLSDRTLSAQFDTLNRVWTNFDHTITSIRPSSGSTTVHPTNDECSTVLGESVVLVATSLSGIKASGKVPSFPNLVATLDPIIANGLTHFNTTLRNGLNLTAIIMIDARQFLVAEGFTATNHALGF
ncbi:hypothetical protein MKEN_00976900 [Mycena kentingensis (nom. inval.)]|nr:hypothetical protein MKEN_00976900 [Mycena kentingensis (nom. inval.)]